MKKIIYLPIIIGSILITSGCDFSNRNENKPAPVYNYEDSIGVKSFKVKDKSKNISFSIDAKKPYIKILDGLDSDKFIVENGKVKLNIIPDFNNPQDANRDNIYEVKVYVVDEDKNDFLLHIKIIVTKSTNDNNGDDNGTNGGIDNNGTNSGDTNNTNGNDDNDTNGGNNDNNNSGGNGDNNGTNGDDNNTNGGGDSNITDSDNDYIPDAVEKFLNKNIHNSDENGNNILDGLEGDPLFEKQWYIRAIGVPTNPSKVASIEGDDLNLLPVYKAYMGYNNGNPIILQIVDSGIDVNHEDLKDNIDLNRSLNGADSGEPTPGGYFRTHGTMLAGIAAARAFNGVGVRGVAPFAKIAGSNWLVQQSLDGLDAAWYSGNGANEIAVTNNSWGTYYTADTFYEDIMEQGTKDLRDGKGRIYVFASGNAREDNADANTQYVINNRYAIVVSALEYNNTVADYSTPGANVWITAYGGSSSYDKGPTIATTYISGESTETWATDEKKNYTYAMAGSSAAAPMVTGAVALILEACPNLRWRDVKYILAKSAKKVDSENPSWVTNSAGFNFSRDYGFGLIDTQKAIELCQNGYKNISTYKWSDIKLDTNESIQNSKTITLNVEKNEKIEWVELTANIDANNASNLDIYLTSPAGTKMLMIKHGTKIDEYHIPVKNWMSNGFRFSTGAFLDENSQGAWSIEIVDRGDANATLTKLELKIHGH